MSPRSLLIACLSAALLWGAMAPVVAAQSSSFNYQQQQQWQRQQQQQQQWQRQQQDQQWQRQQQEQQRRMQQQQQQRQAEMQRQREAQQAAAREQQRRLQEQRAQQQQRQQQMAAQWQQQIDKQRRVQDQDQRSRQQKAANDNLQRQQTLSKQRASEKLRKLAFDKKRRERLQQQRTAREHASQASALAALALLDSVRAAAGSGGNGGDSGGRCPPPGCPDNDNVSPDNVPPYSGSPKVTEGGGSYAAIATGKTTSVGKYLPGSARNVIGAIGQSALDLKKRTEIRRAEKELLAKVKNSVAANDSYANKELLGSITVTSHGVAVTKDVLAKQGSSRLAGDFRGLVGSSVEDIVSRIPKEWKMTPQDRGAGVKFVDEAGFERIRLHGSSTSAPPGSNSASGWTLRIMDREGNYYDNEGNIVPYRDNAGHIPIFGNRNLP